MIIKGFILETSEGGQRAKVKISQGEILDNVLLLHPYGETSNMQNDESSQVLILFANGSKTNTFGIPYNVLSQPNLELTEKAVGNFYSFGTSASRSFSKFYTFKYTMKMTAIKQYVLHVVVGYNTKHVV